MGSCRVSAEVESGYLSKYGAQSGSAAFEAHPENHSELLDLCAEHTTNALTEVSSWFASER